MARLKVEVVCAQRREQRIVELDMEEGASALDAARASGLMRAGAAATGDPPTLGIFGRIVAPDTVLHEGDRVEIYRPLAIDPKQARRVSAAKTPRRKRGAAG